MAHTTLSIKFPKAMSVADMAELCPLIHPFLALGAETRTDTVEPKLSYKIRQDGDAESPRDWDNLGVMYCEHRQYTLGDKDAKDPREMNPETIFLRLPIYMYDHSGITISHGAFSCQWDSGQLGEHYVTVMDAKKEYVGMKLDDPVLMEKVKKQLEGELKVYDNFIQGNCWWYSIEDEEGNVLDTCGGYIGDDLEDTGILDNANDEYHDGLRAAWDSRFN